MPTLAMPTLDIALIVVSKNEEDAAKFNRAHLPDSRQGYCQLFMIVNTEKKSLASIGNQYLDVADVLGLCHADMEFGPGSLQAFYDCAIQGAVSGACGRCMGFVDAGPGLRGCSSYIWSKDWGHPTERQRKAGYPLLAARHLYFACPVSTLDSSCIFFPTNLGLRFDEQTFDGFHLHGEDICLQAHAKGIPVVVPAANAWHACPDVNGPDWGKERDKYKVKLDAKWKGRFPDYVTT